MDTSKKDSIFILGAGGFARETFDVYIDCGRGEQVAGFLEEACIREGEILNERPVRDVSYLKRLDEKPFLIGGIGSTKRKRLIEALEKGGYAFDTVIHPSVIRSKWVDIKQGCIITPGVIMTCQIIVGKHVILNLGVHVGHDVEIGDFTNIAPGAEVMGGVKIGEQVFVGVNATLIEKVTIGNGAIVAAGAVVTEDVPPMSLVAGVPARVRRTYNTIDEKPW